MKITKKENKSELGLKKETSPPVMAKKLLDNNAEVAAKKIVEISGWDLSEKVPRNINAVLEAAKAILDRAGISATPSHQTNIQINIPEKLIRTLAIRGAPIPSDEELDKEGRPLA